MSAKRSSRRSSSPSKTRKGPGPARHSRAGSARQIPARVIAGIAIWLFCSILLGVGIHHLVATGSCSSTGFNEYGPVQTCPAGTGWWVGFLLAGIFGALIGSGMAGSLGLVFAGIFGGIGLGSMSILLDSVSSGAKVFGGIFGGCFAVVGLIAGATVLGSALAWLRGEPQDSAQASSVAPLVKATPVTPAYAAPDLSTLAPALRAVAASPAMSSAATPDTSPPGDGTVDGLARLAQLHAQGALSDAEFAAAKAKLLGEG